MAEATTARADLELLRIPRREAGARAAPKRSRRWVGPLVIIAVLGGVAWLLRDRIAGLAAAASAIPVRTGQVVLSRPGAASELTNATGYVVARTKAAMSAKLAGQLVELHVDAGSRVKKGDLLAKLDDKIMTAALKDAEAGLAGARAEEVSAEARVKIVERDIAKAELDWEESRSMKAMHDVEVKEADRQVKVQEALATSEAGTKDALDAARYRASVARAALARVESASNAFEGATAQKEAEKRGAEARVPVAKEATKRAQAMVETARTNLADTEIRAPFDGVVLKKEADVGEMVVPGLMGGGTTRGAVVTLADFSTLEMEVDVFERDLRHVKEGAPARITLDSYPDDPYPAHVRQIQPTADRQKSTVVVKVAFDRLDDRVLPDMGGRATFLKEGAASAPRAEVLAPAAARTTYEGRPGLFVLVGDRVRFAPAAFGEARRNGVVVQSDLKGGEMVVVDPPAGLADGTVVKRESKDG
jgi:HlyD family secretion protein